MCHKRCDVSRIFSVMYSRQNFASIEWRVLYLSTEETSDRKIRGLSAIRQGVYHPTVVLAASIQKENLKLTEVLERIVSVAATANQAQDSLDHGSDILMDVIDLADPFGRIQRAHHRGSSNLSMVEPEVFNAAMPLRGLDQSMKSSDDLTHLSSSCTTSWSESCRILAVILVKLTSQRKLQPLLTYTLQGNVCYPGLDRCNFGKTYTNAMQSMLHWH